VNDHEFRDRRHDLKSLNKGEPRERKAPLDPATRSIGNYDLPPPVPWVVYLDDALETRCISVGFDNGEPGANQVLLALVLSHLSYSVRHHQVERPRCSLSVSGYLAHQAENVPIRLADLRRTGPAQDDHRLLIVMT